MAERSTARDRLQRASQSVEEVLGHKLQGFIDRLNRTSVVCSVEAELWSPSEAESEYAFRVGSWRTNCGWTRRTTRNLQTGADCSSYGVSAELVEVLNSGFLLLGVGHRLVARLDDVDRRELRAC